MVWVWGVLRLFSFHNRIVSGSLGIVKGIMWGKGILRRSPYIFSHFNHVDGNGVRIVLGFGRGKECVEDFK